MYIPHFIHSPFYVYAYASRLPGETRSKAVYENASEGFASAISRSRGRRTKHYSELLKPFGLDARDPQFWDGGLR